MRMHTIRLQIDVARADRDRRVDFGFTEGGEPLSARACLEYWFGVAHGLGIDATCSSPSMFKWWQYECRDAQYGYTADLAIVNRGEGE